MGLVGRQCSGHLKEMGFGEVYHLKGGILKYLEVISEKDYQKIQMSH